MYQHTGLAEFILLCKNEVVMVSFHGEVKDRNATVLFNANSINERGQFTVCAKEDITNTEVFRFDPKAMCCSTNILMVKTISKFPCGAFKIRFICDYPKWVRVRCFDDLTLLHLLALLRTFLAQLAKDSIHLIVIVISHAILHFFLKE